MSDDEKSKKSHEHSHDEKGVPLKKTPVGQQESRQEHIIAQKHNIGDKEFCRIKRLLAREYGTSNPQQICEAVGKHYICTELVDDTTNKRYHIEHDSQGIVNVWDPRRRCHKSSSKIQDKVYAAYNSKSNRYHAIEGTRKGQFVQGTRRNPQGLVTNDQHRQQWQNPRTGSPRCSKFGQCKGKRCHDKSGDSNRGNPGCEGQESSQPGSRGAGGLGGSDSSGSGGAGDSGINQLAGVRELQRAAADGIEVAAIEARRVNETRLFCSEEQVHSALKDVGAQAAAQAAAGVGGQVAGDILGTIVDNAAAGSVAGRAVAAGVASALVGEGSCQQRLEQAASSAGTSLSLAAAHEAASSVTGPGSVANVAGRALGALVTSGGSLQDRAAHAAQKGGEAAAAEVLGQALAKANVPLCPRSIINEEGRKGVEFSGGSMMSIGSRHRYGSEVKADSVITQSQHEEGVQVRVGRCLSLLRQFTLYRTCLRTKPMCSGILVLQFGVMAVGVALNSQVVLLDETLGACEALNEGCQQALHVRGELHAFAMCDPEVLAP